MKKILTLILLFVSILCVGCSDKSSHILFNKYPFDSDTVKATTNVFKSGERIYYLVVIPKPVKSQRLLIQVVKIGKEGRLGYELVRGKQIKMRDEQIYYYTDYIVMNEAGTYEMRVHSKDLPPKLLTVNRFFVN